MHLNPAEDHKKYYRAMLHGLEGTALQIEEKYGLAGYPPEIVSAALTTATNAVEAERKRILAIVRAVEEQADMDTEHGVGWSQACRSIDNQITQA